MYKNLKELLAIENTLSLLYIEDELETRNTTLELLQIFFHDITVAIDGEDGLEKFKKHKFDLIITDINMPKLSGIELLNAVRKINKDIPVLVLTAYNESDDFLKVIELDIDGYILKPINEERFFSSLYKVVKKIHAFHTQDNYMQRLEEEIASKNDEIFEKLHYDSLTKLLSRYTFFNDIKRMENLAIVLIDIKQFKVINEVYGDIIGSKVLEKFAQYLCLAVDEKSAKVYRLSGDEFAVVDIKLHNDIDHCETVLESFYKILNNIKINIDGNIITIDTTIGIAIYTGESYAHAKIALDYAKKRNKPYCVYSTAIDHKKESTLVLKCRDRINEAIDNNRIVAVYQPIVNAHGNIVKYETLMRIKENDSNILLTPYDFLDTAIKTRLYEFLSEKIIFLALDKIQKTNKVMSINLTYSDIINNSLIKKLKRYLTKNKDIGKRLVFEITENESIKNYANVKKFIVSFREYGVRVAIDDFGTGFSNFEYILEIEPDYLKIDGSLIKSIDTDKRAHTLVQAIVEFSHKLGIGIIAEYVHSETIFYMLKELHVDEYQGYYFSEPIEI